MPTGPHLEEQLNRQHPLFKLAHSIDLSVCEAQLGRVTREQGGRPPLLTRLLAGLHYLKGLYDESDESVVSKWIENPYWQYFMWRENLPASSSVGGRHAQVHWLSQAFGHKTVCY
ncbi:MAG: transposase [Thermosynechococcaceae cyanobacterium]